MRGRPESLIVRIALGFSGLNRTRIVLGEQSRSQSTHGPDVLGPPPVITTGSRKSTRPPTPRPASREDVRVAMSLSHERDRHGLREDRTEAADLQLGPRFQGEGTALVEVTPQSPRHHLQKLTGPGRAAVVHRKIRGVPGAVHRNHFAVLAANVDNRSHVREEALGAFGVIAALGAALPANSNLRRPYSVLRMYAISSRRFPPVASTCSSLRRTAFR